MNTRLLVDTDFLIALIKEDDKNHSKAIGKLKGLKEALIFITPFTIPETVTVLSYKVSQKSAKKFLIKAREKFVELPLNEEVIALADKIFLTQNKKGISWIDCLNAAVVKYYKLDGILSFDKFYPKISVKII
jgi:predicted nucleic acid-binding protein